MSEELNNVNVAMDEDVIDYISQTASAIESYKSLLKEANEKNIKLASQVKVLNDEVKSFKLNKTASTIGASKQSIGLLPIDEAREISNNLYALGFLKQANINEYSQKLTSDPTVISNTIASLIKKVASSFSNSNNFAIGKAVKSDSSTSKQLSYTDQMERKALGL